MYCFGPVIVTETRTAANCCWAECRVGALFMLPWSCREMDESEALMGPAAISVGGELLVSRPGRAGLQIIGCRDFRQMYKQKHRPAPLVRQSAESLRLTYRGVGAPQAPKEEIKQRFKHERRRNHMQTKVGIANDKIFKLPKNVPY